MAQITRIRQKLHKLLLWQKVLLFFATVLIGSNAYASPCLEWDMSPTEHAAKSDVVFEGIVISSTDVSKDAQLKAALQRKYGASIIESIPKGRTVFIVTEVFKGDLGNTAEVWTSNQEYPDSPYLFAPGMRVVIFAKQSENGALSGDDCSVSRNIHISDTSFRKFTAKDMWDYLQSWDW